MLWKGFGDRFEVLFDQAMGPPRLPKEVRDIYGGDWQVGEPQGRPHTLVNFVVSRDGRVSFAEANHLGGGEVSGFNPADAWLMGLLRAGVDAVMVGEGTLRLEPDHVWISEYIFPAETSGFVELRRYLGLKTWPLQVFLSLEGIIPPSAAVLSRPELEVLVVTTEQGEKTAKKALRNAQGGAEVWVMGKKSVDLPCLLHRLWAERQVSVLLCEGGPRVYGSLLGAGLVDEEFLTLSPLMIGATPERFRPSLVEGIAFTPQNAPRSELISLRKSGQHLFLRSRWHYSALASIACPS